MNGDCFIQGMAFDFAQSPAKERGTPKLCGTGGYAQGQGGGGFTLGADPSLDRFHYSALFGSSLGEMMTFYSGNPPLAGNEAPWEGYSWGSLPYSHQYSYSGGRLWRFDFRVEFFAGKNPDDGYGGVTNRMAFVLMRRPFNHGEPVFPMFSGTPREVAYQDGWVIGQGYYRPCRYRPGVLPHVPTEVVPTWEVPLPAGPAVFTHRLELPVPEYCNPVYTCVFGGVGGLGDYPTSISDRRWLISSGRIFRFDLTVTRIDDYWIPYFNLNTNVGKAPLAVTFYDITTLDGSIASRLWNFGDGTTSTVGPNVTKTYNTVGVFPVRLTVTDSTGQVRTSTTRYVTVNVSADFTWSRVTFGPNWIYTFQPVVGASATHHWDFGAHGTSTSVNPQVTVPVLSSGLNATHVATQNGTTDTVTKNVN